MNSKILLVDDEKDIVDLMEEVLRTNRIRSSSRLCAAPDSMV